MITLRHYADEDLALSIELETDPVAMAELNGPRPDEAIRKIHPTRVAERWAFVIEEDGEALGSLFVWDAGGYQEIGWMVLPKAHGRGVATTALRLLLERIDADGTVGEVHAYPGATNVASNRLCASAGFEDLGEEDVAYDGARLFCRHWVRPASR